MWLFKKKKIYKVVYHFLSWYDGRKITEIVRAYNEAGAWRKIVNNYHSGVKSMDSIEEITE